MDMIIGMQTEQQRGERMELASAIQKGFTRNFRYTEAVAIHVANHIAELQSDNRNSLSIAISVEDDLKTYQPDGKRYLTETQRQHICAVVRLVLITGGSFTIGKETDDAKSD